MLEKSEVDNPWIEYLLKADPAAEGYISTSKGIVGTLTRPDKPLKVRILGVLLLQAHGYQAELAVVMTAGDLSGEARRSPLTPNGIAGMLNKATIAAAAEAGISLDPETRDALKVRKQHMSRALTEMDQEGLIDRLVALGNPSKMVGLTVEEAIEAKVGRAVSSFSKNARKRIGRAQVCIYLRSVPRPNGRLDLTECLEMAERRKLKQVTKNGDLTGKSRSSNAIFADQLFIDWGTEFHIDPDVLRKHPEMKTLMLEVQRLHERRQRDEDAFQRQLLMVRSKAELIAREAGKPTTTGTQKPLSFMKPALPPVAAKPNSSKVSASLNPTGKDQERKDLLTVKNGAETSVTPSGRDADTIPLVSQPRLLKGPFHEAEVPQVLEAMLTYSRADEASAKHILMECRRLAPTCTVVQIAEQIHAKGELARKAGNPVGFLRTAVVNMFEGGQAPRIQPASAPEPPLARLRREASHGD